MAKVLVVDDDYAFAEFAKTLLSTLGHAAVLCLGGPKAKATALLEKPDLVLLDLMMPEVDGKEVLRQLKEDPATAGVPVVICSVASTPQNVADILAAGAAGFLRKPLSRDALTRALKDAGGGAFTPPR